ncbi:PIG-L deacetylase family protein [Aliikangiella sp. IMCC44359]|uniref:PIG-L deacetylase family protein n=1 Tax=Aliikangiella sp. IMCC44359 TaxID=3459125 RepID=UPI00403B1FB8
MKHIKHLIKLFLITSLNFFNISIAIFIGISRYIFREKFHVKLIDAKSAFDLKAGDSVLVLAPHPDDETAGMGGTISQLLDNDITVTVALLTDGSKSKAEKLQCINSQERAATRRKEFNNATKLLGVDQTFFGSMEKETAEWPSPQQLESHVQSLIDKFNNCNVKIIFTPPSFDFHPHHRATSTIAKKLASSLKSLPKVICYEVQAPFNSYQPDYWIKLNPLDKQRKAKALKAYTSQIHTLKSVKRLNNLRQSLSLSSAPVEVFTNIEKLVDENALGHGMFPLPTYDIPLLFRSKLNYNARYSPK